MKKLLIISISIIIILALASSVMAKAVKLELAPYGVNKEGEGWGNVILNNPAGTVDLILLVNIKNAEPITTYKVLIWVDGMDWMYLDDILTNSAGNGSLKFDYKDAVDGPLLLTGIRVALNFGGSSHYLTTETGEIEIK
jgi:hypothetical protein